MPVPPAAPRVGSELRLLVVADTEVVVTHALPGAGRVTIGRDPDNAIQIDDESISRHHAVLDVGRVITIEDVGSSNGTKLRDVEIPPHEPRELGVNELVTIGTLALIIQPRFAPARSPHITEPSDEPDDLVIAEATMHDLYTLARRIAASDLPVLILGETGVGKEKMSRVVHDASPRADKPFVAINCAALNDNLLESELFGHERGAFTGAHADKTGLLESAAGGTVFLDEIGEMSLAVQAKLLRVIEDGEVRRVGSLKPRQLGVRFVAATNLDLEDAVERGTFREDLYFRLSAATLVIPPLRERPAEVVALARRFATHKAITSDALALLQRYSWPGNIRELRNVIERAVLLSGDGPIAVEHLPTEKMHGRAAAGTAAPSLTSTPADADERARILDALERAGGNQGRAATLLGVSRRTLINRLVQYDLPRPRKGRPRSRV